LGDTERSGIVFSLGGRGGGEAGCLAGDVTAGHDPDGGLHVSVGADTASCYEYVGESFGCEYAVRDAVTLSFAESEGSELFVEFFVAGLVGLGDVNVDRIGVPAYFIVKDGKVFEIVDIQDVVADNAPCLPDAEQGACGYELHVLEALEIFLVVVFILAERFSGPEVGGGKGLLVCSVEIEGVADVAAADRVSHLPHSGQMAIFEREDAVFDGIFDFAVAGTETGCSHLVPVDSGPEAAKGARHHVALVIAFFVRRPGKGGEVAVSGGVYKDVCANGVEA